MGIKVDGLMMAAQGVLLLLIALCAILSYLSGEIVIARMFIILSILPIIGIAIFDRGG